MSRNYFISLLTPAISAITQMEKQFDPSQQRKSAKEIKDLGALLAKRQEGISSLKSREDQDDDYNSDDESKTRHTRIDQDQSISEYRPIIAGKIKESGRYQEDVDDFIVPQEILSDFERTSSNITFTDFSTCLMPDILSMANTLQKDLSVIDTHHVLDSVSNDEEKPKSEGLELENGIDSLKFKIIKEGFKNLKKSILSVKDRLQKEVLPPSISDLKGISEKPDYYIYFHKETVSLMQQLDLFKKVFTSLELAEKSNHVSILGGIEHLLEKELKQKAIENEIKEFDDFHKASENILNTCNFDYVPSCQSFYSIMAQAKKYQERIKKYNSWYGTPVISKESDSDALKHVSSKIDNLRVIFTKKLENEKSKFDNLCEEAGKSMDYDLAELKKYEANFKQCSLEEGDHTTAKQIQEISKEISKKITVIEGTQQIKQTLDVTTVTQNAQVQILGFPEEIKEQHPDEVQGNNDIKPPNVKPPKIQALFSSIKSGTIKESLLSQYEMLSPLLAKGGFYEDLIYAQLVNEFYIYANESQIKEFDIFFKQLINTKLPPDPLSNNTHAAVVKVHEGLRDQIKHFKMSAFDRSLHKLPPSSLEVFPRYQVNAFSGFSKLLVNNIGKEWITKNLMLHKMSHIKFNQFAAILFDMGINKDQIQHILKNLNQQQPNFDVLFKIINLANIPFTTLSTFYLNVLPTVWDPAVNIDDIDVTVKRADRLFEDFSKKYIALATEKDSSLLFNKKSGKERVKKLGDFFKSSRKGNQGESKEPKDVLVHQAMTITLFLKHGTLGEATDSDGGCSNLDPSSARAFLLKELNLGLSFNQISSLREDQLFRQVINQLQCLALIPLEKQADTVEKSRLLFIFTEACKKADKSVLNLPEVKNLSNRFWQEYCSTELTSVKRMKELLVNFAQSEPIAPSKCRTFCGLWSPANSKKLKENIKSSCITAGIMHAPIVDVPLAIQESAKERKIDFSSRTLIEDAKNPDHLVEIFRSLFGELDLKTLLNDSASKLLKLSPDNNTLLMSSWKSICDIALHAVLQISESVTEVNEMIQSIERVTFQQVAQFEEVDRNTPNLKGSQVTVAETDQVRFLQYNVQHDVQKPMPVVSDAIYNPG